MKKYIFPFLIFNIAFANSYFPKTESVLVFKNKSLAVFSLDIQNQRNDIFFSLPQNFSISQFNVSFSNPKCKVFSLEEKKQKNENLKKLQKQLEEKVFLLEILKKKEKFIQKIPLKETNINSIYEHYRNIHRKIKLLEKEIKNIKNQIKKLSSQKIFKILYSCPQGVNQKLYLTTQTNISALQKYKVSAFVDKNSLKIENTLFVKNNTDIDFNDISVKYYSYKKTSMINPPPFNGFIRPLPYARVEAASKSLPRTIYKESQTKSIFTIEPVTIPKKSSKVFILSSDIYKANFDIYVDGYATVTPFLRGTFYSNKFYPFSYSGEYYIDGIYVGNGYFPSLEKGKENSLFFGEDTFVEVSKEKIKDFTKETFLGKKVRTVKWQYRIKNNHRKKIKITIVDKLPVSHSEKRKIEYFSDIKWKKLEPNGKVIWEVWLKPKEETLFSFGFKEKIED